LGSAGAAVIIVGQTEDFESGGVGGWGNGGAPDPVNIQAGGPLGADDNFLRITADEGGSGGKLTSFNRTAWAGDFTAGNGIVLSVSNFGTTPNTVRISPRIFHAANATTTQGDNITGQLGVDNIRAVPEPGAAMVGLLTGVGCLVRRRRAYRK
jgi:hypothetical protein